MSTHTEQDCLNRIAQMKVWRQNADTALEDKHVIEDASSLLVADMPPYIASVGGSPYARLDSNLYTCNVSNRTFTINIKANTSWTLGGDSMTYSKSSGTGNATVTATCPTSGTYPDAMTYSYRIYLDTSYGRELAYAIRRKG